MSWPTRELMAYPERIFPILELGVLLQLTAGSLAGAFGEPGLNTLRWLLDRQLVSFVASDAHHEQRRLEAMGAAAQVLDQCTGNVCAKNANQS